LKATRRCGAVASGSNGWAHAIQTVLGDILKRIRLLVSDMRRLQITWDSLPLKRCWATGQAGWLISCPNFLKRRSYNNQPPHAC
jgi:hypothetical protein